MTRVNVYMKISEKPPWGGSLPNYVTKYHYLFNLWRSQSCHQKKKLRQNQNSHHTHGLGSVLSQVHCHVQLYQMTSSSSCKLAIWSLWTLSIICFTKIHFWKWFSAMIPLFLYQNLVSVITRFATNAHKYYHSTTRNDPDPATPAMPTIQHDLSRQV